MPHSWHLPSVVGLNPSSLNTDAQKRQLEESQDSVEDELTEDTSTNSIFYATLHNAVSENRRPKLVSADSSSYVSARRHGQTNMDAFSFDERQLKIATAIDQAFRVLDKGIEFGTVSPAHFILKELREAQSLPFARNAADLLYTNSFPNIILLHSIVNNQNMYTVDKDDIIDKVHKSRNTNPNYGYQLSVSQNAFYDFKAGLDNLFFSLTNAHVMDSSSLVVDIQEVRDIIDRISYAVGVHGPSQEDEWRRQGAQDYDRF
jgi:hypothetical protein